MTIESNEYNLLCQQYAEVKAHNDTANASKLQARIVQIACKGQVKPAQVMSMKAKDQFCTDISTTPDKLSATASWHLEKDYIRVKADVTDASFSTDAQEGHPWLASCFEIFVCPTGRDQDICQVLVTPAGPEDKPKILAVRQANTVLNSDKVKASWKRTAKGYTVDVRIPWNMLVDYDPNWKTLPVELAFESNTPAGRAQYAMNRTKDPARKARGYAALVRK